MKKDSIVDYCACILFRALGPIVRILPLNFTMFLGTRLGELFYYFDLKHKTVAYANIKTALGNNLSPSKISHLTKEFYRAFGQNLIEIFIIPLINQEYLNKYISIEGIEFINEGFRRGKGIILLGMHVGSWELSNIICANLGFPFVLFVREQRYPRLNKLLNLYRSQKGSRLIQRQNQTQQLIQALKNNQAVGMTADQGGKTGMLVKFFGKNASVPTGAIKLALKYDATLIPVFYRRIKGPYIKVIVNPIFEIRKTQDTKKDIGHNLHNLISIFEKYIIRYPQEYLWTYKIWKYTDEKNILVLNDGKIGHARQAQAMSNIVCDYFKEKGIQAKVNTQTIKFKHKLARPALILSSCLSGKYQCQGCLWCLRTFLTKDTYKSLISIKPDIIISCGASVAPVNYVLSWENAAKSIVIMRPSFLSVRRFNLAIIPQHDNPPKRKNVVVTEGALNLIDDEYLKEQSQKIVTNYGLQATNFYIGLLIGGDTKNFNLKKETVLETIKQIKSAAEKQDMDILITTSRRTPSEVEKLAKKEFQDYPRCKLLIIANEKNISEAVGGILGLSKIVIVSPESISMISEAVNSKKYVLVFKPPGLKIKYRRFLNRFAKNKYIYLIESSKLCKKIEDICLKNPEIKILKDSLLIREIISKIL